MAGTIGDPDDIGGSGPYGTEQQFASSLGRVSGKALSSNLLRNGVDLTFRNTISSPDILYLDVVNKRIGINRYPLAELDLNISYSHDNVKVTDRLNVDNIGVNQQGYFSTVGLINIEAPGRSFIPMFGLATTGQNGIIFNENYIRGLGGNSDINLEVAGSGQIVLASNTLIDSSVVVSGNINIAGQLRANGTVFLGNEPLDVITITPNLSQNIIPATTDVHSLGSILPVLRWNTIFIPSNIDNVDLPLPQLVNVDNSLIINGNIGQITPATSNTNLILASSTNRVNIQNLVVDNSSVTNSQPDSILELSSSGTGYYKFNTTSAVVIPVGITFQRQFIQAGEIRWNTDFEYVELYNGAQYTTLSGPNFITQEIMEDLSNEWALILG